MAWVIYTLNHPLTEEVRYVGVTHRKARLNEHLSKARNGRTRVAAWVRSLLRSGSRPQMHIVEIGQGEGWPQRERYWIALFSKQGAKLTNLTSGGEGAVGRMVTARQRASATAVCRSRRGQKMSVEARQNMSESHKKAARKERAKGYFRGKFIRSPETLERMSKAQLGKSFRRNTGPPLDMSV
jgi:hypothetical protein